jgi:hypothetical protein
MPHDQRNNHHRDHTEDNPTGLLLGSFTYQSEHSQDCSSFKETQVSDLGKFTNTPQFSQHHPSGS